MYPCSVWSGVALSCQEGIPILSGGTSSTQRRRDQRPWDVLLPHPKWKHKPVRTGHFVKLNIWISWRVFVVLLTVYFYDLYGQKTKNSRRLRSPQSNIFLDYGLIELIRSKSCLMHCHPYWPFFNSERIRLITCYFTLINISIWPINKEQVQTKQYWGSPCIFDVENSCAQSVSAWLTLLYQELINPNKRIVLNNYTQINEVGLVVIVLYHTGSNNILLCCFVVFLGPVYT